MRTPLIQEGSIVIEIKEFGCGYFVETYLYIAGAKARSRGALGRFN